MSVQDKVRKILESIDIEYLDGAEPAQDSSGAAVGGLVFVASKDGDGDASQYEKGEYFTLLQILKDRTGKKRVQMSRNSDGAVFIFPSHASFKLAGAEMKKEKSKEKDKKKKAIKNALKKAIDS